MQHAAVFSRNLRIIGLFIKYGCKKSSVPNDVRGEAYRPHTVRLNFRRSSLFAPTSDVCHMTPAVSELQFYVQQKVISTLQVTPRRLMNAPVKFNGPHVGIIVKSCQDPRMTTRCPSIIV